MDSSKEENILIYKNTCTKCNKNMFSDCIISNCSNCKENLQTESTIVPNPIENVKPRCLIVTRSFGKLTPSTYSATALLHVGISNSFLQVYNFWHSYKIDTPDSGIWESVLNIELESHLLNEFVEDTKFDNALKESFNSQSKTYNKYDDITNNCFDFACRFLNFIKYANLNWTKESLAANLIESKILFCEKYSNIYKMISQLPSNKPKVSEEEVNQGQLSYSRCDGCGEMLYTGGRNRCTVCDDYDLCDKCFNTFGHEHKMFKK
jgi:hypothetical protein